MCVTLCVCAKTKHSRAFKLLIKCEHPSIKVRARRALRRLGRSGFEDFIQMKVTIIYFLRTALIILDYFLLSGYFILHLFYQLWYTLYVRPLTVNTHLFCDHLSQLYWRFNLVINLHCILWIMPFKLNFGSVRW